MDRGSEFRGPGTLGIQFDSPVRVGCVMLYIWPPHGHDVASEPWQENSEKYLTWASSNIMLGEDAEI